MTLEQLLEITRITMSAAEFSFLTTLSTSGEINARLMQHFTPEEDLTIWFGASPRSRKVRDIRQHRHAAVAFQSSTEPAYVTLNGSTLLVEDVDLRQNYWREDWTIFFPGGPAGDDYILIKFVPERIEVMNFAHNVSPPPFGLQPAVLVRKGTSWEVEIGVET
jgi:general stress protein 26